MHFSLRICSVYRRWTLLLLSLLLCYLTSGESFIPLNSPRVSPFQPSSRHITKSTIFNVLNGTVNRFKTVKSNFELAMRRGKIRGGKLQGNLSSNPFTVTNILLGLNVIMFLVLKWKPRLVNLVLKNNYMIARGQEFRLVSSIFAHTSFYHLLMNCYSLHNIGPQVQSIFGSQRYFLIYMFAGIFANAMTYAFNASPLSLGASGSIFGLIGALGIFYWRNLKILGPHARSGS